MQYNIHPILVHFPITLLFLYSAVKILPLKRWIPRVKWNDIRFFLLLFGVLGAFAGLATGETAEHLTRPNHALVEMHSLFATISTWIYGALLIGESAQIWNRTQISMQQRFMRIQKIAVLLERIFVNRYLSILLAVLGFVAIAITGMLGGAMVYGTTADPFAETVLKLLHLSI